MSKKYGLLVSIVLLLNIAAISSATDIIWDNGAADANWNNGLNWSGDVVPGTASDQYARIRTTTGPVFSGQTASVYRIYLEVANGTITMNSGSLTTINHIYAAAASTDTATINMSGGAINIGGTFYIARDAGSVANVNLSGGTITCNILNMRTSGGTGTINITTTGKLIINGDATAYVTTCVSSGWIKAYGGAGTVMKDFNITTPGKTTVWASAPIKAGSPSPANSAANVSTLADLSWTGILGATSHNVYFGTASPGTFQINTTSTTYDPGRLSANKTYFWRIDEKIDSNVVSTGDVWTFTTGSNVATNPTPANGAVNVSVTGTLSWTAGVSASSHNVYFGTANPPAFAVNQTAATYNPGTLAVDTTYYWRIDEVEDVNNTYTGTVWSFTTEGSFKKGAYLIYPGNNTQMTVLWQMTNTTSSTLVWGLDPNCTTGSTSTTEYGTDHQHKYTITGLTPGTKYYYRVTAGVAQTTGSFRTAPAANATSVKFLAYGDTRTYPADHSTGAAGINSAIAADPGFQTMLLHVGDWVQADSETNWTDEFFNRSYSPALQMESTLPIQGAIGNHEGGANTYTKYWPYPYVADKYWSFDYGPAHIAIIDQYSSDYSNANSPQLLWLANDLSTSTKKWKFIVFHNPGWSAGGGHSNDAEVQAHIQPLCEQYGVQIVFAGHNHYYSRAVVNGVHHVTTGAGGAPLYNPAAGQPNIVITAKTAEFCKISIDGNSLTCQAVQPDGTVIDQFYVDKEEPDFTFVQATDPQIGWVFSGNNCGGQNMDSKWLETVNGINIVNPAFVVVTGDLTDSKSNSAAIAYYKSSAAQLNPSITMYNLPGNHDIDDAPSAATYAIWQTNFSSSGTANPWFSFTYGNNLFINLDSLVLKNPSNYPGKDTEELNWLTTTLQNASDYNNIMVFMHTPLCMNAINEADGTNNMPLAVRNQLLNLFHTYGVKAVFSGHAHNNSYVRDGDLEIITTSSCLCSLGSPATPQGFRVIKVYPNHIEHEYISNPVIVCIPGDFNCDGVVDFKDMGIFTGHWLDGGLWP